MNSAPGHIPEEVEDEQPVDHRRGMKLIPCDTLKKATRVRINLDENLRHPTMRRATRNRETNLTRGTFEGDHFEGTALLSQGPVIAFAAIVGLAIGYLVGRRRDG